MGLAAEMCEIIRKHARGRPVSGVDIDIGRFSGVNRESFAFCAQSIFETELSPDIEIRMRDLPGTFVCSCGCEYKAADLSDPCPECGGYDRTAAGGDELILTSIEIEE